MTNFLDLPKVVRETIYRLHLVREGSITWTEFHNDSTHVDSHYYCCLGKRVQHLLHSHHTIDKEAAPIYFGENSFDMLGLRELNYFITELQPRHYRRIRSLTVRWDGFTHRCAETFRLIGRLGELQQLRIHVDEENWIGQEICQRPNLRWHESLGLSQQLHLLLLHRVGMNGLRDIRKIAELQFLKFKPTAGDDPDAGGAIAGGCLETFVRQEINGHERKRKGKFRFLDLPGELRTRIYNLLLCWAGVVYPINRLPTSVLTKAHNVSAEAKDDLPRPGSALSLLAVNRAIHDEAVGIFYWNNDFVFSWPLELQSFVMSLGPQRLSFVRNITLFHKDHKEGTMHSMDLTLSMLRLLPNLRKLHILWESAMVNDGLSRSGTPYRGHPGGLHGVKTLFTLRGIKDLKLRDLELEERLAREVKSTYDRTRHDIWKKQAQVLRHLNHGLALAQTGTVVAALSKEQSWHIPRYSDGIYPKLGDRFCSDEGGCSCPETGDEADIGEAQVPQA